MEGSELEDIAKLQAVLCETIVENETSNPEIEKVRKCREACDDALKMLDRFRRKVCGALRNCQRRRFALSRRIAKHHKVRPPSARSETIVCHVKYPYFLDAKQFHPPLNEDAKKIQKLRLPYPSRVFRNNIWTRKQKDLVRKHVLQQTRELAIKNGKNSTDEPIEESIVPLDANRDPYDWDDIASKPAVGHNADECRAIWRLFIHPSVNKRPWAMDETNRLRVLAEKYKLQNWDSIAKSLNTHRTGYQCFTYFKMFVCRNALKGVKWTTEEDMYLFNIVENCRVGDYIPWSKVAYYMGDRSKQQIYNRWTHLYKYPNKGKFSREEMAVIKSAVQVYGKQFRKIAKFLPGRSGLAIANNYHMYMAHSNEQNWTAAEDAHIINQIRNKQFDLNELCKLLHNNTPLSVRRRYNFLVRWNKMNPYADVTTIPRHKNKLVSKTEAQANLVVSLKKLYKNCNRSLLHRPPRTVLYNNRLDDADKRIIHYFHQFGAFKLDHNIRKEPPMSNTNILELKAILYLMNAKLDIDLVKSNSSLSNNLKNIIQRLNVVEPINEPIKRTGLKTYSRKNKTNNFQSTASVAGISNPATSNMNIWLNNNTNNSALKYCFPPSLHSISASITLTLLKHQKNYYKNIQCINEVFSKDSNQNRALFVNRFEALFKWPFLLSNILPNKQLALVIEDENTDIL